MKPELIETMRANTHGRIDLWDLHMTRLHHSASLLGYAIPTLPTMAIQVAEQIALSRQTQNAHIDAWRVRFLLSEQGALQITAVPLPALATTDTPLKVAISQTPLDSQEFWLQHKSTHRPWYEHATAWLAAHPEYFDVLFINERGEICEGSRSNVYIQHDGAWLTPKLTAGLLPGVLRRHLLQHGKVTECTLRREQLRDNAIVRLSNGLRGWFDVELDTQTRID